MSEIDFSSFSVRATAALAKTVLREAYKKHKGVFMAPDGRYGCGLRIKFKADRRKGVYIIAYGVGNDCFFPRIRYEGIELTVTSDELNEALNWVLDWRGLAKTQWPQTPPMACVRVAAPGPTWEDVVIAEPSESYLWSRQAHELAHQIQGRTPLHRTAET